MDDRFEYPLPVLSVSTDMLMIETKDRGEGRFTVKNTGGSTLAGRILSRARGITFEPGEWEGNEATITYRFMPEASDGWKPGDVLDTCAIISSNGGEKKIQITVRLTKMAIATDEGITIANIRDFYDYASAYPAQARRLFVDSEFYMLLLATGFEYMEAYELLHKDMNRDRALDNFFILAGLKKKTVLSIPQRHIEFVRKPNETAMIYGSFLVQKNDAGFLEAPLTPQTGASWLALSAERLITSDFNEANTAMVKFSIDPLRIKGRYAEETVAVGSPEPENHVALVFKRRAAFMARLGKEAYRFEDHGFIDIVNHTGGDLLLELFCGDAFVRFAARKYPAGEHLEIPFDIKLSAFMTAQLLFRKLPFLRTTIEVRTVYRDAVIIRKLPLTVGEW